MQIKPLQIRTFAKLGMERSFFGMAMPEVVAAHPDVYVVTADLCGYSGMDRLLKAHPEAVVNVGIQEQNMLGIACGIGELGIDGTELVEQIKKSVPAKYLDINTEAFNEGLRTGEKYKGDQ